MTSKSVHFRQYYEACLKSLLDQEDRLIGAREEGRAEGLAEALEEEILVGKIQLLQQLLGEEETSRATLLQLGSHGLNERFTKLWERYSARNR